METTTIYKEEFLNPNIWRLVLIELGLEPDADEVTVTAVSDNEKDEE